MFKKIKKNIKKNFEIAGLIILILSTAIFTTYFNYNKKKATEYDSFIDNVYFKKTLTHIIDKLQPKYKKIKHKIKPRETFDKILESYLIDKEEIEKIKKSLIELSKVFKEK